MGTAMSSRRRNWWQRVSAFWDNLFALCEGGLAWAARRLGRTLRTQRGRALLGVEQLEPRLVPNSAPVAVNDSSYTTHMSTALNVNSTLGVLANDTDSDS